MESYGKTDIGKVRTNNEDALIINDELKLFLVADGMGGQSAGEVASRMACEEVDRFIVERLKLGKIEPSKRLELLKLAVKHANEIIYKKASSEPALKTMGTTIVCAWIVDDRLYVVHAGDSRLYRIRDGVLEQLTTDHNKLAEQVASGKVSVDVAKNLGYENILTKAVGVKEHIEPDAKEYDFKQSDAMLLCTDGLVKMINDDKISKIVNDTKLNNKEKVEKLIQETLLAGAEDNVTVIFVTGDKYKPKPLSLQAIKQKYVAKARKGKDVIQVNNKALAPIFIAVILVLALVVIGIMKFKRVEFEKQQAIQKQQAVEKQFEQQKAQAEKKAEEQEKLRKDQIKIQAEEAVQKAQAAAVAAQKAAQATAKTIQKAKAERKAAKVKQKTLEEQQKQQVKQPAIQTEQQKQQAKAVKQTETTQGRSVIQKPNAGQTPTLSTNHTAGSPEQAEKISNETHTTNSALTTTPTSASTSSNKGVKK
jgi:protein phosphatase